MPAKSDPRVDSRALIDDRGEGPETRRGVKLYRRRRITASDWLPAIGAGIAVGVAAAYLTQLMLRRTPLGTAHPRGRQQKRGG